MTKKGHVSEFGFDYNHHKRLRDHSNGIKPFIAHWVEYKLVDEFKLACDSSLKPDPLNGVKQSALCCRCFYLPAEPEEIEDAYMNFNRWKGDINILAPMVISIGKFDKNPMMLDYNVPSSHLGSYYTCKNLDRKKGGCLDYENRPGTCKGFPYETYDIKMCGRCSTQPHCNGAISVGL